MKFNFYPKFILVVSFIFCHYGYGMAYQDNEKHMSPAFIENKGQIRNQYNELNDDVLFLYSRDNFNVQLKSNRISYELRESIGRREFIVLKDTLNKFHKHTYAYSRIDIEFVNSNDQPVVKTYGKSDYWMKFFKSGYSVSEVYGYSRVVYYDLYPNIDLEFILEGNKPKYNFIIRPGGNVSDIMIQYNGKCRTFLKENEINIETDLGGLKETIPFSFILENGREVDVYYKKLDVSENLYGFDIESYDSNETLVVDPVPNLIWSTYFGGEGEDTSFSVDIDETGNVYVSGVTNSLNNIATDGAFQGEISGDSDGFVSKFTSEGTLVWSTYIGGVDYEMCRRIRVDGNSLYVNGRTFSSDFYTTSTVHQEEYGGLQDVFLFKMDFDGDIIWSTFFGGEGDDGTSAISFYEDAVFIVGSTSSEENISTVGAYQDFLNGPMDGFIASFQKSSGLINWATYYGGSNEERFFSLDFDDGGNIFVVGDSRSEDFATSGAFQEEPSADLNSILARFDKNGQLIWSTFYSANFGQSFDVKVRDTVVYFSGATSGYASNFYGTEGVCEQGVYVYGQPGYVAAFDLDGYRLWSTYVSFQSTNDKLFLTRLEISEHDEIYAFGFGDGNLNQVNNNAFQSQKAWVTDGVIIKLDIDGQCLWRTHFGGSNGNTYIRDGKITLDDEVIITGNTLSNKLHVTEGAHQDTLVGERSGFLSKFHQLCDTVGFDVNLTHIKDETCLNDTDGQIEVSISGGFEPYLIDWNNGQDSTFLDSLASGAYVLSFDDNMGCKGGLYQFEIEKGPFIESFMVLGSTVVNSVDTFEYLVFLDYEMYELEWSVEGGDIIGYNDSSAVYVSWNDTLGGKVSLSVSIQDCEKSDTLSTSITTSIKSHDNMSFLIYPNPVSSELFVDGLNDDRRFKISLFDSFGKHVISNDFMGKTSFSVRGLASGGYFYSITDVTDEKVVNTGKVIID